jgi:MFS family permease
VADRGNTLFSKKFLLVTASAMAYFLAYGVLLPTLPVYVEDELGGGKVAVGVAVGAFAVLALILRPFAGRLGDARGRRLLMVTGASLVGATTLSFVAVSSTPMLALLRLAGGAGEALFFVGAVSAVGDMSPPERRGEAVSLFSISLYAGIAFGPSLGESVRDAWGSHAVWILSASLAGVAALLGTRTPDDRPVGVEPAPAQRGVHAWLHPAAVIPGLVMLTSVWGFAGFSAFMPKYAIDDLAMSGARLVLLMYGGIMILIRGFGARIPDRFGVARVGKVSLATSAAGLLIIGATGTRTGLFAGAAVFAMGQALAFPAFMALAISNAPPTQRGAAAGTLTAFVDLGFFVGPVSLGVLAGAWGNRAVFLGASGVAVAGVVLQALLARRPVAARTVPEPGGCTGVA